jgi:threonine synthase
VHGRLPVRPWYNRNTAYNPFMTEGKKTVAYEIAEQSGWTVPDQVFVGVGDGCIIGGLHKGFADLAALGLTTSLPRLMGVQAAGSDYLHQAWRTGEDPLTKPAIQADTVADSISAGLPRDRLKALRAVRETNGAFLRIDDPAILRAIPILAQNTGVFAEPAGAAALAGAMAAAQSGQLRSEGDNLPPDHRFRPEGRGLGYPGLLRPKPYADGGSCWLEGIGAGLEGLGCKELPRLALSR